MLDSQTRNQIISIMDQENAAIAETLECEEYRSVLWALLTNHIQSLNVAVRSPDITPDATVITPYSIIDMMTILRLAQSKLMEAILEGDDV